jgi:hypothetical protein
MIKVNDRVRLIPEFAKLDVPMAGTVVREADGGYVVVQWDSGQKATFTPEVLVPADDAQR